MIGFFLGWLERLVAFGLKLAAELVKGILGAPIVAAKRAAMATTVRRAEAGEVVDLRAKVLRAGRPREDAVWDGDVEPETRHWVAEHDGRIVAIATVLKRPTPDGRPGTWQLRGMATDPDLQGTGVGRRLLQAVEREVGEGLWCNARTTALPFYEKAGWKTVSETFDVAGVGPHRRMVR